jgi:hypothetical protein
MIPPSLRLLAAALALSTFVGIAPSARADRPAGVYSLSPGVNNPNTPQDDRLANIRDYDFVSGYTLRLFWSDIETSQGVYDFGVIDEAIEILAPLNQGLSLELFVGEEPQYVLDGASTTYLDHRGGVNPVPWDSFAQERHAALYAALGSHVVQSSGATHALRDDPTLRSIDAAPAGLNFGVRDLNGGIRSHPDYTQQRYINAVASGVAASAAAFPHDRNFLAFFAFNDSQPGVPVDEQIIERLAPLYNGAGQTELAFFIENLSDDGPVPQPNGMGPGNNLLDWTNRGGSTMMQALDSWLLHRPDRDEQLDSLNPATGIELADDAYGTRFFELYIADLDAAANGALDAAGNPLIDDLRYWNELLTNPLHVHDADFNDSGTVDAADLTHWQTGFGEANGAEPTQGDANGDQAVDGNDFLIWQRQLAEANAAGYTLAIPEPRSWLLLATSLISSLIHQQRSANRRSRVTSP